MNIFLKNYINVIIIIVIVLLACLTMNRGIYLYFNNKYKNIDERLKEYDKKYKKNSLYIPNINSKTNLEQTGNENINSKTNLEQTGNENINKEERLNEYNQIKEDEKKLNIQHFRIQLLGSVIVLILSFFIKKTQLKIGFLLAAFINIFINTLKSWYQINEAEKFSITAFSLIIIVIFVLKFYDN